MRESSLFKQPQQKLLGTKKSESRAFLITIFSVLQKWLFNLNINTKQKHTEGDGELYKEQIRLTTSKPLIKFSIINETIRHYMPPGVIQQEIHFTTLFNILAKKSSLNITKFQLPATNYQFKGNTEDKEGLLSTIMEYIIRKIQKTEILWDTKLSFLIQYFTRKKNKEEKTID